MLMPRLFSRATSIEGLLLVDEPDWEVLESGPPTLLVAELERLEALARATELRLQRLRSERAAAARVGRVRRRSPPAPSGQPPRRRRTR